MPICRVVYYAKGCKAPGYCYHGPRDHEECIPAKCQSCSTIISKLKLKQYFPINHDARNCPCVPYQTPNERKKMTNETADKLYETADKLYVDYLKSGNLAYQIKIENRNRDTNIWSVNKNLRKINVDDLFEKELNSSSYASVLLSEKGGSKGVSSEIVSSVVVSSKVVSSKVVSSVDKSLEVTSSEDESDEVKSIRLLLKKFQNLKEVWTDTGNGTEEEFRKINECILSLTDELNKIV